MGKSERPIAVKADSVEERRGTIYPKPYDAGFDKRIKQALGDVFGLTQFGVNLVTLEPGAMSSQRHWHAYEEEFVYVLEGETTLVTDEGETSLGPGMAAGFPAGEQNGHHLINRTEASVLYLEVGTRSARDKVDYPDVDMKARKEDGRWSVTRKDGTSFDVSD